VVCWWEEVVLLVGRSHVLHGTPALQNENKDILFFILLFFIVIKIVNPYMLKACNTKSLISLKMFVSNAFALSFVSSNMVEFWLTYLKKSKN
jgi:hypothetical protein